MKLNPRAYMVCTAVFFSLLCAGSAAQAATLHIFNTSEKTIVLKCTIETFYRPRAKHLCEGLCGGNKPNVISSKELRIGKKSQDSIDLKFNQTITIMIYYVSRDGESEEYLDKITGIKGNGSTPVSMQINVPRDNGQVSFFI